MKTLTKTSMRGHNSRNGSALLVAVILGAAIALALGSFLFIATSELRMANRTGQMAMVSNVAESGMEEVLAVLNTPTTNSAANPSIDPLTDSLNPLNTGVWTNADYDGNSTADRRKIFTSYASTSQQVTSSVSVLLLSTGTAKRYFVAAKAVSSNAGARPIEKFAWAAIQRKPLVPPGMYARNLIELKGTSVAIDAFRSSLGIYGAVLTSPPPDAYQGKNIFSYATVASATSTVNVGQADIYGNVATSGPDPLATVGNTGIIGEWGDPNGTKNAGQTATNFTAEFEVFTPSDAPAGIPKYVSDINTDPGLGVTFQLGDPSFTSGAAPWVYYIKASEIDGSELYTVVGPTRIVIVPETSGQYNGSDGKIAFSGSGGIKVNYIPEVFDLNSGGVPELKDSWIPSLQIWTRGDISMSGQGLVNDPVSGTASGSNAGIPLAVQIYGYAADTGSASTAGQDFSFTGNQAISATIYAPNANVKLGGGGSDDIDMMGSIIAKNITLNGKVKFHVDLDLANAENGKFGVSVWRELLTQDERSGAEMSISYSFGL